MRRLFEDGSFLRAAAYLKVGNDKEIFPFESMVYISIYSKNLTVTNRESLDCPNLSLLPLLRRVSNYALPLPNEGPKPRLRGIKQKKIQIIPLNHDLDLFLGSVERNSKLTYCFTRGLVTQLRSYYPLSCIAAFL